jgi:hypothetical protein
MKSIRLVSELEQISPRTLEWWWYEQKKVQQEAAAKAKKPPVGRVVKSEVVPALEAAPGQQEPPAKLDTDHGELRCSRCRSSQIEQQEKDSFYCRICQRSLHFEGFVEEKTSEFPLYGKDSWMA